MELTSFSAESSSDPEEISQEIISDLTGGSQPFKVKCCPLNVLFHKLSLKICKMSHYMFSTKS